jgi:hypothetical protein
MKKRKKTLMKKRKKTLMKKRKKRTLTKRTLTKRTLTKRVLHELMLFFFATTCLSVGFDSSVLLKKQPSSVRVFREGASKVSAGTSCVAAFVGSNRMAGQFAQLSRSYGSLAPTRHTSS